MNTADSFDVVIVGGASVGAAAAAALEQLGYEVAVVDRAEPVALDDDAALEPRVVAVSPGSMQLLEAIGAQERLRWQRIAPYHEMQVMAGRGHIEFRATEHGLTTLGWIAELAELDRALWEELSSRRRVTRLVPAELDTLAVDADGATLRLVDGRGIRGAILIGADGQKSRVRAAAGIGVASHHYNQKAIVTHLETEKLNPGIAWQRFTDAGPLALLPLPEGGSSLVWSVETDFADRLLELNDEAFIEQLATHAAGSPFGAVESVTERHAIPLVRRQSERLAAGRIALAGDAARSVHPLAGQGLNLGLGDVAALVDALCDRRGGWRRERDPTEHLARYARRRGSDSILVAGGIHLINETRSFGRFAPHLLGAGFDAMRLSRSAREIFVRRACGIREVRDAVGRLGRH